MPGRSRQTFGVLAVAGSLGLLLLLPLAGCAAGAGAGTTAQAEPLSPDHDRKGDLSTALTELKIRAGLLQHLKLDALGIGIDVAGDTATLTGEVHEAASKTVAEEVALTVEGVHDVRNRIRVKSEDQQGETPVARAVDKAGNRVADALLEARVKTRLLEEIGKTAFDIEVEATDQTVVLRGTVPDDERRELAVRTAEKTDGVDKVHDLITVHQG